MITSLALGDQPKQFFMMEVEPNLYITLRSRLEVYVGANADRFGSVDLN